MSDPSALVLRSFRQTDIAFVTAIYAHYVNNSAATFDIEAPDVRQTGEKFAVLEQAGHPVIIAQYRDRVAGFAYASTFRARPAYRFTCENALYLAPDMVGRGFGSQLLGELIAQSRAFGFNQMVAIITAGTDNSVALHKKHGFEILGRFPELGYKFERWHDVIHLQKKL